MKFLMPKSQACSTNRPLATAGRTTALTLGWSGLNLRRLFVLVLFLIPFSPGLSVASEFENIMAVLEQYYISQVDQDMGTYLGTRYFQADAERKTAQLLTASTWEQATLGDVVLGPAQVVLGQTEDEALVRFQIAYTVTLKQGGEAFRRVEQNAAFLVEREVWKIRRVTSQAELENPPQALDEVRYQQLQQDRDLYMGLTSPPEPGQVQQGEIAKQTGHAELAGNVEQASTSPSMAQDLPTAAVTAVPMASRSEPNLAGVTKIPTTGKNLSPVVEQSKLDITTGLLLSYDFTSAPVGEMVEDLSGNGYSGKLNGPVWKGEAGLYFDGQSDHVEVEGGAKLHADKALTVIGEFITTSYAKKTWQNLVWKGNIPDGKGGASDCTRNCENREFALWLNSGAYLHATSTSKDKVGKGQTHFGTPGGSVNGKTVFAQVIDSENKSMKVFINGKQVASQPYSASGLRRTDGPLLIGGGEPIDKNWYFRGYMRWLRIYDRPLTEAEVAAVARHSKPETVKPWRKPYQLDDAVVKGGWASISPIQDDSYFDKLDLGKMEPGIVIKDGWFTHPNDRQKNEIVYLHDGTPLRLSGHATILDCLDRCAGGAGLVDMMIMGDGKELWNSGKIKHKSPGRDFDIDLTGVKEVRLVTTDGGNGISEDWAAWLNLKLTWPDPGSAAATVKVRKPTRPQPADVEIAGPSGRKGQVDAVYTLDRKPDGSQMVSLVEFPGNTEEIFIWFQYSDLEAGDVLTGIWTDIGRQRELRVVPVVVAESKGAAGFVLRRPVSGWFKGNYLVEIKRGGNVLGSSEFTVDD